MLHLKRRCSGRPRKGGYRLALIQHAAQQRVDTDLLLSQVMISAQRFYSLNTFSSQIEEELERKKRAKKEARAQKRKNDKVATIKETEPKAKKARQVKRQRCSHT